MQGAAPNLDIVLDKLAHQVIFDATQTWADMEKHTEIDETLLLDAREVLQLQEMVNGAFDEVDNPFQDEELSGMDIDDGDESAQHGHGWKDMLSPPAYYVEMSGFFAPLKTFAQSYDNAEAEHVVRKDEMYVLAAYTSSTKTRQIDIREYSTWMRGV